MPWGQYWRCAYIRCLRACWSTCTQTRTQAHCLYLQTSPLCPYFGGCTGRLGNFWRWVLFSYWWSARIQPCWHRRIRGWPSDLANSSIWSSHWWCRRHSTGRHPRNRLAIWKCSLRRCRSVVPFSLFSLWSNGRWRVKRMGRSICSFVRIIGRWKCCRSLLFRLLAWCSWIFFCWNWVLGSYGSNLGWFCRLKLHWNTYRSTSTP